MKFFSYGQTVTPDNFHEAQNAASDLGVYEQAEKKLAPITFRDRYKGIFQIGNFFMLVYPFASVLTGFATAYICAEPFLGNKGLAEILIFGVILILSLLLLMAVEKGKMSLCNAYFHAKFNNGRATPTFVIFLVISIVISALGGYQISSRINDKTANFNALERSGIDSVKQNYSAQIMADSAQISELSKALKKEKSKWTRLVLSEQLSKATERQTQNTKELSRAIDKTTEKNSEKLVFSMEKQTKTAIITSSVITVFELVFVICVWFSFWYAAGLRTENRNFGFVEVITFEDFTTKKVQNNYQIVAQEQTKQIQQVQQKVGFAFGKDEPRINEPRINEPRIDEPRIDEPRIDEPRIDEPRKDLITHNAICPNCSSPFTKNSPTHKYCCDDCRKQAWENRTGKKFTPKGKKQI